MTNPGGSGAAAVNVTTVPIAMPLPLPTSKEAPHFTGSRVRQYLETIEHLGRAAGYTKNQLPPLILMYASSKVRKTMAQEGTVLNGNDWDVAKDLVLYYYGSAGANRCTPAKLRSFSESARKKKITSRRQVDQYHRRFRQKAGSLVADQKVTQAEADYLFYKGFHKGLRSSIKPRLVSVLAGQNKQLLASTPPTMAETLSAARAQFDPDDIDYSTDDESTSDDSAPDSGDSSGDDSSDGSTNEGSSDGDRSKRRRHKKKGKKTKRGRSREGRSHGSRSRAASKDKDERRGRMDTGDKRELRELVETVKGSQKGMVELVDSMKQFAVQTGISSSRSLFRDNSPANVPQMYGQARACFMCGKTEGVDLDHRINIRDCPDTRDLIASDVIRFSPLGVLVRADGSPLPRSPGPGTGGIAAILRQEANGNQSAKGKERDAPPHQQFARTVMNVGLCAGGRPVLGGSTTAVSTETVYAFPTTRAQAKAGKDDVEKQVRFEEERQAPTWKKTYRSPHVHKPADVAGEFTKKYGASQVPAAPHPANTEEGWREKQHQKARVDDATDDEGKNRPKMAKSNSYRFTSTIQEQISTDAVREQILDSKVTLSLREILGMSPELQRIMQALVKTRREFGVKAGEWANDDITADTVGEDVGTMAPDEPGAALLTYNQETEDLHDILQRYASAVAIGAKKHFAMTCGLVKGVFGSEKVTFLVDSGSELNLITRRVWEQTDVAIDEDGQRWSLRGIGGESVSLLGCARDAPVQIAGKNFDHSFFVSTREHGAYDGILGQPWLTWFSTDVSYNRAGPTYLRAYPSGDKTGAFISVEICETNHPRNTDRLVLTSSARIEDADDDDEQDF